mmetsp:Transcript_109231/g.189324  ORF Transcript_109231/g.189324 Transcript_109231/m.189324 type:complete len:506 (-) Transcript_109231:221-1738(-)
MCISGATEALAKKRTQPRPERPSGTPPASYYDALAICGDGDKRTFTAEEVAKHNVPTDGWMSFRDGVYDVTNFINKHPGGSVIVLGLGRDSTILVESYHPSGCPDKTLEKYRIGTLQEYKTFYAWNESEFYPELKRRVVKKIKDQGLSRRGGMELKGLMILSTFLLSLYGMVAYGSWMCAIIWGVSGAQVGLSIQHDGNHGAFSKNAWVNRLAGMCMDVIGASSMAWEYQHVVGHHQYTNLMSDESNQHPENDPDVFSSYPLMRMHPTNKRKPHHRYQHLYAIPLFALMTMSKVLMSDIQTAVAGRLGPIDCSGRLGPLSGRILFWTSKLLTLIFTVLTPIYLHGIGKGLALFTLGHLMCGEYLAICFIINHINESCDYLTPESITESKRTELVNQKTKEAASAQKHPTPPANDWAVTQVQCCVNWSSGSMGANIFSGGLNHQIEHHLFPSIAHCHYPSIAPVVQEVCNEYGVPYKSYASFGTALKGMFQHMWDMGQPDAPSQAN